MRGSADPGGLARGAAVLATGDELSLTELLGSEEFFARAQAAVRRR